MFFKVYSQKDGFKLPGATVYFGAPAAGFAGAGALDACII